LTTKSGCTSSFSALQPAGRKTGPYAAYFPSNRHGNMLLKIELIAGGCCLSAVFMLWSQDQAATSASMPLTEESRNSISFKERLKTAIFKPMSLTQQHSVNIRQLLTIDI
jgi:hypothetical protein